MDPIYLMIIGNSSDNDWTACAPSWWFTVLFLLLLLLLLYDNGTQDVQRLGTMAFIKYMYDRYTHAPVHLI